jgi:hypothetical protein
MHDTITGPRTVGLCTAIGQVPEQVKSHALAQVTAYTEQVNRAAADANSTTVDAHLERAAFWACTARGLHHHQDITAAGGVGAGILHRRPRRRRCEAGTDPRSSDGRTPPPGSRSHCRLSSDVAEVVRLTCGPPLASDATTVSSSHRIWRISAWDLPVRPHQWVTVRLVLTKVDSCVRLYLTRRLT